MQGREDTTSFIKSFTGSHHFVLDYLIEEVLEQQSESIQTFLLQTAVLDRLTDSLCNALTGQDNGQATLEMLKHANLFIVSLDEERRWYRYHHLFSDLLRQRLRSRQSEQLPILHSRASEWYEQNGFADEAIEHALQSDHFERATHLIETRWQHGEYNVLRRWLHRLPAELVFTKPHLCILQAWDLFHRGSHDAAERNLQAAEQALETSSDGAAGTPLTEQDHLSDSERMEIQGRAAVIRSFLAISRGDVQGASKYARRALECLPKQDLIWRSTTAMALGDACVIKGDIAAAHQARIDTLEMSTKTSVIYLILIANGRLAETLRQQGKLKQVIGLCEQQMQYASECGISQTVAAGWLLAIRGETLAELDNLDLAMNQALKGIELVERGEGGKEVAFLSAGAACTCSGCCFPRGI